MNYLSIDGGGTKLNAIWYNENMHLLGCARAKGINSTITPKAECQRQMRACFDQLFQNHPPREIETMYVTFGNGKEFAECLPEGISLKQICNIGEARGGLLAGRGRATGYLILSGTGSDALYVGESKSDYVGGLGQILGDEGSGVWMARQAVQGAVRHASGWGEETMLTEMLKTRLNLPKFPTDMVQYLYSSPAPFQQMGSLLPMVGEAAKAGDKLCHEVFLRGAYMLSRQSIALIKRHEDFDNVIITCGGAWKAYQPMFDAYAAYMQEAYPGCQVYRPWFEHVIAGPMKMLLEQGSTPEAARDLLLKSFPAYEWRM